MEEHDDASSGGGKRKLRPIVACGCASRCLFKKIPRIRAGNLRRRYAELPRKERDMLLFQSIAVRCAPPREGVVKRRVGSIYRVNAGTDCRKVCRRAFMILFGISQDKITRITKTKKIEDAIAPAKLESGGARIKNGTESGDDDE